MNIETTPQNRGNGSEPTTAATQQSRGGNGQSQPGQPLVISHPNDVANLVLMQIDAVNTKKDELTITMKNLTDTAKQLVRAYSEHTGTILVLRQKLEELENQNLKQSAIQT